MIYHPWIQGSSSLMITFQRDGSQVLEKEFLGGKTGEKLGDD